MKLIEIPYILFFLWSPDEEILISLLTGQSEWKISYRKVPLELWDLSALSYSGMCVYVCVSRWSVKERWAAVGPALPARRMSLCLMSTLVEPVSWAPGPQMTSLVNNSLRVCVCLLLANARFPNRPEEPPIWVTHRWCTPSPLHVFGATETLWTNSLCCVEMNTNTHVLHTNRL